MFQAIVVSYINEVVQAIILSLSYHVLEKEVIKVIDNISKGIKGQSCYSFLKKIVALKTSAQPKTIVYTRASAKSRAKSNLFFSKLVLFLEIEEVSLSLIFRKLVYLRVS